MKVLAAIVVPPHLSASGGAKAGEQLSGALAPYCDITIANMLSSESNNGSNIEGERPRRLPVQTKLPLFFPRAGWADRYRALFYRSDIPQIVKRGGFDLVHLHNPMPALEMARIARACRVAGIPYVVSTHGFNEVANGRTIYGFDPFRQSMWELLVEKPVAQVVGGASGVFALSPADFGIVEKLGCPSSRVSVVSNGVSMPPPADRNADAAVCERLGISPQRSPDQITCMFLANHTPNKGLPDLLAAFAQLKRPYLLIVGGEKRTNIDYDRAVVCCGRGQSIVVTGRLPDDEVAALFRRSDIFVFPTLADTFPLVVLEAMSHGLPVIASRVGGIPYQVNDRSGLIVSPANTGEIVNAVESLARDPARRTAMGQNARARVAADFTWKRAASEAFAGYQRALKVHRATGRQTTWRGNRAPRAESTASFGGRHGG